MYSQLTGVLIPCARPLSFTQSISVIERNRAPTGKKRSSRGRHVAVLSLEVKLAASEVSRARLRTYQVLAFSEVLVDRLGESSSMQILSEDLCIQVAREVFSTHNHEGLCAALARLGQTWFSARVLI